MLSAVLDVAQEGQITSEKATVLQAAWRRRNVQGKFQTAVQEMMEINGLIEVPRHAGFSFTYWRAIFGGRRLSLTTSRYLACCAARHGRT